MSRRVVVDFSSSLATSLSRSWNLVVCVVCSSVGSVVGVVVMEGRGMCWLLESAANNVTFHGVSFRAILCRGEPGHGCKCALVSSSQALCSVRDAWQPFLTASSIACSV